MITYSDYAAEEHAAQHPKEFNFNGYPGAGRTGLDRMKCKQCGLVIVKADKQIKTRNTVTTQWVLEHFLIIEWP